METSMTSSMVVPVIDVQSDNFKELWPAMIMAIKTASFIALDTELSGLGNRKALLAQSIEDRYKAISHAARSRSIISLGIACYKKIDQKVADTYLVQVYNLTLLCSEEYTIEPQSVKFLVQHGFDFNKQYSQGIPYNKGNNKEGSDYCGVNIRAMFTEMLRARKPLVLHNGLIDIAFLYQSFYAHLPDRLDTFTADLSEMFPAGLYDTKYVTEFELRLAASYLEYAYKKCKLDNSRRVACGAAGAQVHVEFCQYGGYMSTYVDYRPCPAVTSREEKIDVCQSFSAFGWCPKGVQCPLSHDTDVIILQDEKSKKDKKRKRQKQKRKNREEGTDDDPQNKIPHMEAAPQSHADSLSQKASDGNEQNEGESQNAESNTGSQDNGDKTAITATMDGSDKNAKINTNNGEGDEKSSTDRSVDAEKKKTDAGTHRAGFDAFMTGYIFAYSSTLVAKNEEGDAAEEMEEKIEKLWLPDCLNKVYLSGKAAPLNLVKSCFAKSSKAHLQKMEMVWGKNANSAT